MRPFFLFLLLAFAPCLLFGQAMTQAEVDQMMSQPKPSYCFAPAEATPFSAPGGSPTPVPQYPTLASVCYKVQVAILRAKDPTEFAFHPSLTARWRPCEEVWVVETRETWCDRQEAEAFQGRLKELGYPDTYITKLIGYE